MRLGQLARKYGVSLHEITSYLQEVDPESKKLGRNSKLDDNMTALVAEHFENLDLLNDPDATPLEAPPQQDDEVADTSGTEETTEDLVDELPKDDEIDKPVERSEEEVIATDKLLEILESEEESPDLSKITLIKAPKKELEGLKVVGKIELPEPKIKKTEETETSKKEDIRGKRNRKQRPQLSEEEKEKNRLKAKRKKEQYEARQEKRRKAKEKQRRKALNKARYQEKLQKHKDTQPKPKAKSEESSTTDAATQAPPKTIFGKFWRWMNT